MAYSIILKKQLLLASQLVTDLSVTVPHFGPAPGPAPAVMWPLSTSQSGACLKFS